MVFAALFVPSKSTILGMIVAKNITYSRLEKIPGITKDIQAILKQDILDIIHEVQDPPPPEK